MEELSILRSSPGPANSLHHVQVRDLAILLSIHKFSERRKYPRIVKPYIVRFRIKPDVTRDLASREWDMVTVNNLSAGGIFYYAGKNLQIDTVLDLKIGFSLSYPSIICVGRVIRIRRNPVIPSSGFAIEFTEIDKQIRKVINTATEKARKELHKYTGMVQVE